ncbi:MAG: SDR family NAD(P)-dependent oxidoreductase [Alphaproteobacteria bacterium]|nr:SDR family NAD(P)-dependent oxidoreductase [Alphaproteobacteria bacterium]
MSKLPLAGRVALVAGATRGAGRGIAAALGEAGAKVWLTGRSVRGAAPSGRPETLEDTAELVASLGGEPRWRRVDHLEPEQVGALCAEIRAEDGGLDLLVNDIWGGDALTAWGKPIWEHPLEDGLRLLRTAVHTHLITSHFAAPLLLEREGGLLVEITDGVGDYYRGTAFYDLAKADTRRMAQILHTELAPLGHAALAVTPGFLRSEAVLDHFGVTEARWRDAVAQDPHFVASETPRFVGRGIAALAADPERARFGGQVLSSGVLGRRYGLEDVDGRRPDFGTYSRDLLREALAGIEDWAGATASVEALTEAVGELAAPFVMINGPALLAALRAGGQGEAALQATVEACLQLG